MDNWDPAVTDGLARDREVILFNNAGISSSGGETPANPRAFARAMDEKFGTKGNRLFYLAVAPEFFADIIARLGMHGMTTPEKGPGRWTQTLAFRTMLPDLKGRLTPIT
jgi:hypothetical protein